VCMCVRCINVMLLTDELCTFCMLFYTRVDEKRVFRSALKSDKDYTDRFTKLVLHVAFSLLPPRSQRTKKAKLFKSARANTWMDQCSQK
jgi:hypothetical protein